MTNRNLSTPAGAAAHGDVHVSVPIPAKNEADNLPTLREAVRTRLEVAAREKDA